MSEAIPGALDRLVRMQPSQVANFILSTGVVRESVMSSGETLMLLPERGVMPIYWAADGHPDEENTMAGDGFIRLPIGSFDFETPDHDIRKGTLTYQQKQAIVARHRTDLQEAGRILIIDEVQKGGTLTDLVSIVERQRGSERSNRLYVIAAQDSRKRVSAEAKKAAYQTMASGGREGVTANVVPMPLIGTDCDTLLNQLWYAGSTRVPVEHDPQIDTRQNDEAELILRMLGMASRNREALEDTSILDSKVFSFPLGEKASSRIEQWREGLIAGLRTKII